MPKSDEYSPSTEYTNDLIDLSALGSAGDDPQTAKTHNLQGIWAKAFTVIAVVSGLFHLYTGGYRPLPAMQQRPIHIAFILIFTFMLYPASKKWRGAARPRVTDLLLLVAGAVSTLYLAWNYREISLRAGVMTQMDMTMAVIFILVLIEAGRRAIGMIMLVLAAVFISYLFIGPWLPGILRHGGFSLGRVLQHMYLRVEGVFGIAVGVSATYVYLFILFGAFLSKSGTTQVFADLALAMAGHSPGGPAKVGVIASGLMGTIQGSSAANVAATGLFTIPLMKSLGFKPYFAAAVEAVASCGGQFLPPVMGASAFIMAEYLGVPYGYVAAGALLPALLYYAAVYYQIHLRAKRLGMEGIPRNRLPALKAVILQKGHLLLPIVVLITFIIMQFTALFSAFIATFSVLLISSLRKRTRMSIRDIIDGLTMGARNSISTALACAIVGFVVGAVSLSGLGMLFTQELVRTGGGLLLPTLLLAAFASLILSFGLPTTSVYIITATLVAPGLVAVGLPPLVAHLFCYYWGGVSAITPPVALAVYVGSGIAGSNVMKSGFMAMRLGIAAYIVPFYFAYWPALVTRVDASFTDVAMAVMGGIITIFALAVVSELYFLRKVPLYKAGLLLVAVLFIMYPNSLSHLLAVGITLFVGISELVMYRRENSAVAA